MLLFSLKLEFAQTIVPEKVMVLAQDLASDKATDITDHIRIQDNYVYIPGELITRVGLSAASEGDLSEPGMVMRIHKRTSKP
jgi:hypothetical protein